MDGGAASAAVEVLIQQLINVSKEEISLIRGLEKEAGKLRKTLAMIQSYLDDAEKKFITEDAVKTWLKELEAVAFDADNVLDELKYHVLSKKVQSMENQETEEKKVPSCFPSCFNHYSRRRQMALKIKQINMTFESISKRATQLGLESKLASAPAAPDARLETNSFTVDPIFIGRDDDVSRIVEMLTSIPTDQQVFSILPIVGMGGLGKTTLTRQVYNDEKIQTHFGKCIWVHVPKNFDTVSLLEKILTTLKSDEKVEAGSSQQVILTRLQEAFGNKKWLLVLDDVWNQDHTKWEDFKNSLSGISSVKGSAIIVTTRNAEVASIVHTLPIYELKALPVDNCWSIIQRKAFEGGDVPSEFENIGRNIAERCGGLPLAASVVGGLLLGKSKDDWLSIKQNWLSSADGNEDNISKILKVSYDNLPSPFLKKCFAYCSIFPKGREISKQQLIELWMAEGFLQPDQVNDMETVGKQFSNLLLQNSLLQIVWRDDYGNIRECSMHDLVHDLACSVLGSRKVNDGICQVRYIGPECDGDESSHIPKEASKYLRTLFFVGEISNGMFSHFECLHTLTLWGDHITELPSSIGKLIHLRYFDTAYTRIEYLPDSIGKLYLLQTLRTTDELFSSDHLKKLPSTFKYLISLRHLHISYLIEFPHEVGRLTSLQTLPYFPVGKEKGKKIIELGGLKYLKGTLEIRNLQNVRDKEEAKSACLSQKPNLVKLVLCWNEPREGETNDENVLEGLQPHSNLKSLHIKGFKGACFPSWTFKMAVQDEVAGRLVGLDNLTVITLDGCTECEEIPMLGHLPHLKSLKLKGLTNVRSIGSSFYGMDNCRPNSGVCRQTINVFPALERLKLRSMSNLKEWLGVEFPSATETQPCEVKVFPRLEYLKIVDCKQLMSAPSHFPGLKELVVAGFDSGLPLANICGITLASLTNLKIGASTESECLPAWLFHNNKNLRELTIFNCPNLRELPDGLQTLQYLEELEIDRCQNLKSIPSSSSGGGESRSLTSSLRKLLICSCEKLINLPGQIIESSAPSLEMLHLSDLTSVTNFSEVMKDCLPKMCRLTELGIKNVPQFISNTTCTEIGKILKLQRLQVSPSPDSRDCGSFSETVDRILQGGLHSLNQLELIGMEDWDSLPDQLQHLTTLSNLELCNFGIETLPEWFENLSSLKRLALYGCKKLRSMPSKEAMQRLTKLHSLWIVKCPELEERCKMELQNDDSDSEWPKISHIPRVHLGGHHFHNGEKLW